MAVAIDFQSEEYLLGQRIQRIRKERGLSQTQLGDLMGMDRSAISNYENGSKGEMGFKTLKRFAEVLGTKPSNLLGEKEEEEILEGLNAENLEMIAKVADGLRLKQAMTA